ncbi:hypothetical protein J6590_076070 [Homalodisca vitripennis]|nr:hypothetical protein J6590_076070 [Homalodisca vitripennis]
MIPLAYVGGYAKAEGFKRKCVVLRCDLLMECSRQASPRRQMKESSTPFSTRPNTMAVTQACCLLQTMTPSVCTTLMSIR